MTLEAERLMRAKRLKKRYGDPIFRERLKQMRQMIGGGSSLHEIREKLDIKNDLLWGDLVYSLARAFVSPESMYLEWQIRQETRYKMGMDLYNLAKKDKDLDAIAKAIMVVSKIDENAIELQRALGMLKPMDQEREQDVTPISNEELANAEARFNDLLEQKIARKLELQREAEPPEFIDVQPRIEPRGEADRLDQAPLAQNPAPGQQ